MSIEIDKKRLFEEIRSKFAALKEQNRETEPIFLGINNSAVFKNGSVTEDGTLLRILEVKEWKKELSIYCTSGILVKAIEPFKGEVTQVVYFEELGSEQAFELRYYALEWACGVSNFAPDETINTDPRSNVIPKVLTNYEYLEVCIYIYAELKPMNTVGWKSCCVCGIYRAETLQCVWNSELDFCGPTCQSIAWSQRKHDEKTSVGGDTDETDYYREAHDIKKLENGVNSMNV